VGPLSSQHAISSVVGVGVGYRYTVGILQVETKRSLLIAPMMEATSTFETSVNFYQTAWGNISKDSYLHTRRSENLKSHQQLRRITLVQD
jgi:hypothetical protein